MSSIADSISKAESLLATSGVAEPRREAMSLLMLATKKDKAFLYAFPEHIISPHEAATLETFLERRSRREPLQYISGVQEFYGLEFEVTVDVLIPRPETEMVVERALEILRTSVGKFICDVGTGSGCIAVSILHKLEAARAIGLDISPAALDIAKRNAERHNVDVRLKLIGSHIFSALTNEKFDLIVANPPYIPVREMAGLQPEVRDFEPHSALTDSSDGLSIIRQIVQQAPQFLTPAGHLLLEIGIDQSAKVAAMFETAEWRPPELFSDLQGIPRVVSAQLN